MDPTAMAPADLLSSVLAAANDGDLADRPDPPPRDKLPTMSPQVEGELVAHVRDLFLKARQKRRPLVERWNRNYRMLRTKRWADGKAGWAPRSEVPEIWPVVDSLVAWITDQTPEFTVTPAVPPLHPLFDQMDSLAQDLKTTMEANWWVDRNDAEVEKVAWDGMTYGIGWFKTTWDGTASKGQGNAVSRRRDPYAVYPDPEATSMENLNYLIDAATISKQELERRWPGALARLNDVAWTEQVDSQQSTVDQVGTKMPMANPGAISPATSPRYGLPGQSRETVANDPGVTVFEAWLRQPVTDEDGSTYDGWRCVVVAGNRVLMDESADGLWSHGQHPYDRYVPLETGEFYGTAMVEMLSPMQESINGLLRSMEHNIWLTGNPVMVEDTRAGISRTAITNKPGQRITKNSGGEVKWMEPPQMAPGLASELIKFYVDEMERVSGLSSVVRGATPTGRNAQGVIDSVQEAAFVRIRKNRRNLSMAIGSAGEKSAAMIVEFYDSPRIVSLLGPSGEATTKALQADHFYVPGPEGRMPMRFRLLIDGGERAAQSRTQRIGEADALYAMGAIDAEALLKIHELPGWQNVVQRQRELQAQQGTLGQPPTQRAAARR